MCKHEINDDRTVGWHVRAHSQGEVCLTRCPQIGGATIIISYRGFPRPAKIARVRFSHETSTILFLLLAAFKFKRKVKGSYYMNLKPLPRKSIVLFACNWVIALSQRILLREERCSIQFMTAQPSMTSKPPSSKCVGGLRDHRHGISTRVLR